MRQGDGAMYKAYTYRNREAAKDLRKRKGPTTHPPHKRWNKELIVHTDHALFLLNMYKDLLSLSYQVVAHISLD